MRIAFLWSELTGYANACLKALIARHGPEILFVESVKSGDRPFAREAFDWVTRLDRYHFDPTEGELATALDAFGPELIIGVSWHVPAYRSVLRRFRGKARRVLFMDNQWLGGPKQRVGQAIAPWYLAPLYDAVFLPGRRQAEFARRLGFRETQIAYGAYACDWEVFSASYRERQAAAPGELRPAFLFVGRLVEAKGLRTLAAAYARYRGLAGEPWPLLVAGTGPLEPELSRVEGAECLGFVQPAELPRLLLRASCLVLPSTYEPWAVVVHEAVTAGLSVICSAACGAGDHLVVSGVNGLVVPTGSVPRLTEALLAQSRLPPDALRSQSAASHRLSQSYSPALWADTVVRL